MLSKNYSIYIGLAGLFLVTAISIVLSGSTPISAASAEDNYANYCAGCHGERLESFVNRKWIYGNSWNEVQYAIKYGYPNDGMPPYDTAFTDNELNQLTDYVLNALEQVTIAEFEEKPDYSGVVYSDHLAFTIDTVISGLDIPWGIGFLPNGEMLITERNGTFFRADASGNLFEIEGTPTVKARGQGGLMDVEIHPDYTSNGYVYLSYSIPKGDESSTAVMRARLDNDQLVDKKIIFEGSPYLPTRHHYGSRIEFDREGYLYLSMGDRGRRDQNPQSLANHSGKIHRIHDDGRIPADNPFINTPGAMPSIYSYGHRNPQGLAMNPSDGSIWESEHGPRGGDEVNVIHGGRNYGWPVISYGINYNGTKFTDLTHKEGMEQPELYWVPAIGTCGLTFVSSDKYPAWSGDLLAGSLRFNYIARLIIVDNKITGEEKLLKNIGRVRDIKIGNDGYIYFTVEKPGYVLRIKPV